MAGVAVSEDYDDEPNYEPQVPNLFTPDIYMIGEDKATAIHMSLAALKHQCKAALDAVLPFVQYPEGCPVTEAQVGAELPPDQQSLFLGDPEAYRATHEGEYSAARRKAAKKVFEARKRELGDMEMTLSEYRAYVAKYLLTEKWNFAHADPTTDAPKHSVTHEFEIYDEQLHITRQRFSFWSGVDTFHSRTAVHDQQTSPYDLLYGLQYAYTAHALVLADTRGQQGQTAFFRNIAKKLEQFAQRATDRNKTFQSKGLGYGFNSKDSDFGANPDMCQLYHDAHTDAYGWANELLIMIGSLKGRQPGLPLADTEANIEFFNNVIAPCTDAYWIEFRLQITKPGSPPEMHNIQWHQYYRADTQTIYPFYAKQTTDHGADFRNEEFDVTYLHNYPVHAPFRNGRRNLTELDVLCEALRVQHHPDVKGDFTPLTTSDEAYTADEPAKDFKLRVYYSRQHPSIGPWTVCWIYFNEQVLGVAVQAPVFLPFFARPGFRPSGNGRGGGRSGGRRGHHEDEDIPPFVENGPDPFAMVPPPPGAGHNMAPTRHITNEHGARLPVFNVNAPPMQPPPPMQPAPPQRGTQPPRKLVQRLGAPHTTSEVSLQSLADGVEEIKRALNDVSLLKAAMVEA